MSEALRKCTLADLRVEHRVWEVSTVDENGEPLDCIDCQHDNDGCDSRWFCVNCHAEWWDWEEASRHVAGLNDHGALDQIQAILSVEQWSPETLDNVARLVRASGREIYDTADHEDEEGD